MPLYDYECPRCGSFELMRSISTRDDSAHCPDCGTQASRLVGVPSYALMDAGTRTAHATNERARHEPKLASQHVHGPNCGCGKPGRSTVRTPEGAKTFPSKRPWMISH
ncbi:MAG: zinc ribbon domain-containing protein [Rhodocyclaceae bacterium]